MSNYRGQSFGLQGSAFSTRDVYKRDKDREEGVRRKKITMDPEKRAGLAIQFIFVHEKMNMNLGKIRVYQKLVKAIAREQKRAQTQV